jgi:hypothetical protein
VPMVYMPSAQLRGTPLQYVLLEYLLVTWPSEMLGL